MNTYLQLLWQSVLAPRAATDLSRQHPNTFGLGWIFVAANAVLSLVLDLLARRIFPQNYVPDPQVPESLAWLDSPLPLGIGTGLFLALAYVLLRKFWRVLSEQSVPQSAIDATIAVAFACSLVMLIPQYLILETSNNLSTLLQLLGWTAPLLATWLITSVSYSHGLNMSYGRAVILNLLSSIFLLIVFVILALAAMYVWALLTGAPIAEMLGVTGATG